MLGYLASYMIVITLIFALVGGYSYNNLVKNSREKALSDMAYAVGRYADSLDGNLLNIMDISASFYGSPEIARLRKLSGRFMPGEYVRFLELSRTLARYTNNNIERVTLYFHNSQAFIASDMVETRPRSYFHIRSQEFTKPYEAWREEQLAREPNILYVPDGAGGGPLYLYYKLPFYDNGTGVTVIFSLRLADTTETLSVSDGYASAVILTDGAGRTLYAPGGAAEGLRERISGVSGAAAIEYDGVTYNWYTRDSSFTDWKIHYLVDERELYSGSASLTGSLLTVYIAVLALTVLLAVYFSKSTSDPLVSILRVIDGEGGAPAAPGLKTRHFRFMNGNRLRYVWQKVSDISESNTRLTRQVKNYQDTSRGVFFYKLLRGDVMLPEEIIMAQVQEPMLFSSVYFVVAAAQFASSHGHETDADVSLTLETATRLAVEWTAARKAEGFCIHKLAADRIAVVLCSNGELSRDEVTEPLGAMSDEIFQKTGIIVRWGIGVPVRNTDQIFISGQNAIQILCHAGILGRPERFVWHDESKRAKRRYSVETEQRLINALTNGDRDTAKKILRETVEQNEPLLAAYDAQRAQFVAAVTETAYRTEGLIAEISTEDEKTLGLYLWQMKYIQEPEQILEYLYMIADVLCDIVERGGNNRAQKLMGSLCGYIGETYEDPNLCLTSISDHFNLTESYISAFFKQNGGMNISQYIEKIRMLRAGELLTETEQSTAAVAGRVGYGNANTFYKAFKRYYGVNPKVFRAREAGDDDSTA